MKKLIKRSKKVLTRYVDIICSYIHTYIRGLCLFNQNNGRGCSYLVIAPQKWKGARHSNYYTCSYSQEGGSL